MASNLEIRCKQAIKCKGCGKEVQLLLSHLKRTKKPCKALYDIKTLEAEAKAVQKEQMAVRNRDRYHNDPNESRRKKAASKEYYRKRIKEKESTNQKSHDEIHDTAEPPNLPKIPVRIVCDVCEKVFAGGMGGRGGAVD